jgi:hypothetical protein
MKAIVLLAHEMDSNGLLSPESAVRAEAVAKLASKSPEAIVIAPGWAYRKDTKTPVGQAMKNYLVDKCGLQGGRIFVESHSHADSQNELQSVRNAHGQQSSKLKRIDFRASQSKNVSRMRASAWGWSW